MSSPVIRDACTEGGYDYESFEAGALFKANTVLLADLMAAQGSAQFVVARRTLGTLRVVAEKFGFQLTEVDPDHATSATTSADRSPRSLPDRGELTGWAFLLGLCTIWGLASGTLIYAGICVWRARHAQ